MSLAATAMRDDATRPLVSRTSSFAHRKEIVVTILAHHDLARTIRVRSGT